MLFKSFREKRKRENEYFERVIEDAKRRECQQILLEESLWGEEWETRKPLQEFSEEELQLLSPISQKAYCSQIAPDVFKDKVALAISKELNLYPNIQAIKPQCFLTSLADVHYIHEMRKYLKRNPRATVVDVNCNFNTLFFQVYNKKLKWFNVDNELILSLRSRLGLDSHRFIEQILCHQQDDFGWLTKIPYNKNKGFIVLLNDSPRAWNPRDLKNLLITLQNNYPNSLVLLNCSGGKAGINRDKFTFYSLNAKSPLHAWLTNATTRIYTSSSLDKGAAVNLKTKLKQELKHLHRNGHQILVGIKF